MEIHLAALLLLMSTPQWHGRCCRLVLPKSFFSSLSSPGPFRQVQNGPSALSEPTESVNRKEPESSREASLSSPKAIASPARRWDALPLRKREEPNDPKRFGDVAPRENQN